MNPFKKRKNLPAVVVASLCAVAFFAAPALFAGDVNHTEAQVKVWIPDDWAQEADADSLIITDPNDEVMVAFLVVDSENITAALDAMEAELSKIVEEISSETEPKEIKLNGMPAVVLDGKGKVQGEAVDLGIVIILTPAKKALLVFAIAQSATVANHEKTIEKVLGGIRPLK